LSSIAINNNVGSVEVVAAAKHKDLLGHIRKDDESLGVSNAVKKRGRDLSIAGVERVLRSSGV